MLDLNVAVLTPDSLNRLDFIHDHVHVPTHVLVARNPLREQPIPTLHIPTLVLPFLVRMSVLRITTLVAILGTLGRTQLNVMHDQLLLLLQILPPLNPFYLLMSLTN
jgi:hypothetical protein